MAEIKTKKTNKSVAAFVAKAPTQQRRKDAKVLLKIFGEITKKKPVMWGPSIIGYDTFHYKSERSSQEGDWPMVGFSPRKQSLTLYVLGGFKDQQTLLRKLGKHKTSVACLYVNKLPDVDISVLKKIIAGSYKEMKRRYK